MVNNCPVGNSPLISPPMCYSYIAITIHQGRNLLTKVCREYNICKIDSVPASDVSVYLNWHRQEEWTESWNRGLVYILSQVPSSH